MKRRVCPEVVVVREEEEAIGVKEVWTDIIYPFLYNEGIGFWVNLCLVSKNWMTMVGGIRGISLVKLSSAGAQQNEVMKRFGGSVKKCFDFDSGIAENMEFFPLEYCNYWYRVSGLSHLTSLTLPSHIGIENIDKMVNLTHLTIEVNYIAHIHLSEVTTLKYLCLTIASRYSYTKVITLSLPLKSKIEYLWSNKMGVFKDMDYSGRGRFGGGGGGDNYFEGNWVKGIRQGKGSVFMNGGYTRFEGVWENNKVAGGDIKDDWSSYTGYVEEDYISEGDIVIYKNGYGEDSRLNGVVYKGFHLNGMKHGEGRLYVCGTLVKTGEWRFDELCK
jgi:hypothetical protein